MSSLPNRTDKDGYRQIVAISNALKAESCDYLFGGTVNFDNSAVTISTYLMNTDPLSLSRRTGNFFYDRSVPIAQLASSISKSLVIELAPKFIAPRKFEIGCFRLLGSNADPSDAGQKASAEKLAQRVQGTLTDVLAQQSGNPDVSASEKAVCESAEATFSDPNSFGLLTGDIAITQRGGSLTPRIRLSVRDSENGSRSVPISLAPTSFDAGRTSIAVQNYVDQVTLFLRALGQSDHALFDLTDVRFKVDDALLLDRFKALTTEDTDALDPDAYLVLGYKALSREAADPLSFAILGGALVLKGKWELAATNLSRAKQLLEDPSAAVSFRSNNARGPSFERTYVSAHLMELLSVAQSNIGYSESADSSIRMAKVEYQRINDPEGISRSDRIAARLLLRRHEIDAAVARLQDSTAVISSYKTLILLGSLQASQGKLGDAIKSLDLGMNQLDRSDKSSRVSLGDAYEAVGDQFLDAGDFPNGRLSFEKALRAREAQSTRYKIGFAAKKSGDLGTAVEAFKAVTLDQTDAKGRWVEASWLEMLEANLLLGHFASVVADARAATEMLSGARYGDSRFVIQYLSFVAESFVVPATPPDTLVRDLDGLRSYRTGSAANLKWKSDNIDRLISEPQSYLDRDHSYTLRNLDLVRQAQSIVLNSN